MVRITFLGTAGGRFATFMQTRRTGGLVVRGSSQIHLDPGPGALRAALHYGITPSETDVIFISHAHTEHYTDGEVLVEAMTSGGWNPRGAILGARSALLGEGGMGPSISAYHLSLVDDVRPMSPGERFEAGDMVLEAAPTRHTDPTGIGLRLHTANGVISYTADTALDDGVKAAHRGARILVLNLTILHEINGVKHLTPATAADLIGDLGPEMAVLTHFGQRMLVSGPDRVAGRLTDRTGVRTVAARDGMVIDIGEEISVSAAE